MLSDGIFKITRLRLKDSIAEFKGVALELRSLLHNTRGNAMQFVARSGRWLLTQVFADEKEIVIVPEVVVQVLGAGEKLRRASGAKIFEQLKRIQQILGAFAPFVEVF